MIQIRPTFSESWYRVVGLKPRLRGTAQISRQYYRGERWYVVRDAASNQFHRLSDAAYRFVGLLDGTRTVGDAWDLVGGQLADDVPTQPEVIQILSQLYAANLVETDIPPDATVLLRRHKKQMQRRLQGRLMNVLFPRVPVWDPDRFVCRWMPIARMAFSKVGAVVWLAVIAFALFMIAPDWSRLKLQSYNALQIREHPQTFLLGFLVFWVIKFIHECGHAFSCRRFGGEVHEMGLMLLVFVPTPYVDASTAWAFPNKWARMFVGAAGMIVEMFVAAICAIAWARVSADTMLSDMLCYAMIIASFSTVVFNANPLLRYDGYYMLSDFLEIPNLQMRSREYVLGLIKRHVFRIKATQPLPPPGQRTLLFFYGIASSCYRVFVGIMIILVVTWQLPVIGVLMALGGVITWIVTPAVKLVKYLALEPELHRKRGRAWAFSGAVTATAILLIGFIPFPHSIYAAGIVEPKNKQVIYAKQPGKVTRILAKDGQPLKKGDVILICEDDELDSRIVQLELELRKAEATIQADRDKHPELVAVDRTKRDSVQNQLDDARLRQSELTLAAEVDGFLIAPELRNMQDAYLDRGTEVATVASTDILLIKAVIQQSESQLAAGMEPKTTDVRLISNPSIVLHAQSTELSPAATDRVAHPILTRVGGNDVAPDPEDKSGTKTLVKQYELRAEVANPDSIYYAGQSVRIRLKLRWEPMYVRWYAGFLQLMNSHSNNKWL